MKRPLKMRTTAWVAGLLFIAPLHSMAADLFTTTFTCSGVCSGTETVSYSTAKDAVGLNIDQIFPSFNDATDGLLASVDFRGITLSVYSPEQGNAMGLNPTAVYFSAPGIPIKVFDQGGTRDENTDLLWEYLKAEGLSLLSKTLVANSPSDPLAGNPDSLMSMMMTNEFDQGFTNNVSEIEATSIAVQQDGGQVGNLIGIGLTYGSIKNAGIKTDSYTLPLSYSVRNQIDPRRQLTLRMPIALTSTEGAKAAQVGLGASYSFPVTDRWTLTPSVNYSLTGSIDLASAGQFASGSLTSSYFFPLAAGRKLAIGNMVGYYQTLDFTYDNLKYDPGIKSTVLRNGVMYSMPVKLGGKKMAMEYSLVDNRFFGTDLYMDSYQEVGVTLGTRKSYRSPDSYLRAGLTYIHAPNSNGFRLNVSYWF